VADVFELEGEVRFERASFNALNLDRVVKLSFLGHDVAAAMVAEASARAEAPLDLDVKPLVEADHRFAAYRAAFLKAAAARRELSELDSRQAPELDAIARERAAVEADLNLSGSELGAALARLDARGAELTRAAAALRSGLEVLDARVQAAQPAAQRAVAQAARAIRRQRQAHELTLRRACREELQNEHVQAALWVLGTVAAAEQMLLGDGAPDAGLLDRLAGEDMLDAPAGGAAAPGRTRAAAV
jgi:hypothetical protein